MHNNLRHTYPPVFTVNATGGFPHQSQAGGIQPPLVPCWTLPPAQVQLKRRGWGGLGSAGCLLIMVLITVFAALGLGAYQIMTLQKDVEHLKKEMNPQTESRTPQRLRAHLEEEPKERKHAPAAHLIGAARDSQSNPLKWESKHGSAFTHEILYTDGGLQVNETGLYFVYSHVEFIFNDCKPKEALTHTVYIKRSEKINVPLMKDHREGFCQSKSVWSAGSNLGSMHELRKSDWVFVNVSHPDKLSTDHQSNYFGLFKLP